VTLPGAIDGAALPLDRARVAISRRFGRSLAPWIASRERRVAWLGAAAVGFALIGTLAAPLTLLVWAPLVLGVPHLLADWRYLVARPGLHRRRPVVLGMGVPLALAGAAGDIRMGIAATLGAVAAASGSAARRTAILVAASLALALATWAPAAMTLVLLHLHNLVALAAWWAWRKDRPLAHGLVAALAVAGWATLAAGGFDAWVGRGGPFVGNADTSAIAASIAPGGSPTAYHLLLAWIFGQSLHYAVWLRLVPEDARARRTPRPFRASAHALAIDVGLPVMAGSLLAWAALLVWGLLDPGAARAGYLAGALFHGHLELAALALAWMEARRPGEAAWAPCVERARNAEQPPGALGA
jgi:hypothetical protein